MSTTHNVLLFFLDILSYFPNLSLSYHRYNNIIVFYFPNPSLSHHRINNYNYNNIYRSRKWNNQDVETWKVSIISIVLSSSGENTAISPLSNYFYHSRPSWFAEAYLSLLQKQLSLTPAESSVSFTLLLVLLFLSSELSVDIQLATSSSQEHPGSNDAHLDLSWVDENLNSNNNNIAFNF